MAAGALTPIVSRIMPGCRASWPGSRRDALILPLGTSLWHPACCGLRGVRGHRALRRAVCNATFGFNRVLIGLRLSWSNGKQGDSLGFQRRSGLAARCGAARAPGRRQLPVRMSPYRVAPGVGRPGRGQARQGEGRPGRAQEVPARVQAARPARWPAPAKREIMRPGPCPTVPQVGKPVAGKTS